MRAEGALRTGSGEPLLLIHGFSGVPEMWRPVLGGLAGSFDVLVVGLAGHTGGPDLPEGTGASVTALVDVVEREMDAAGFASAHVVGNSLGGWIALELANRGRARSVVALSPAGGWERGSSEEKRLERLFRRSHAISTRMLPLMPKLLARPRMRRAVLAQAMARADRLDPDTALAIVRGAVECTIYFDLMEAVLRDGPPSGFEQISCPVLLAWGTKDAILPAKRYAQRMRNLVPGAHWMDLPRLGHVPMGDEPQLIAQLIADFASAAAPHGAPGEDEIVVQALA
jgi:pimeloyl-ACP methyl ester carboxylesterase